MAMASSRNETASFSSPFASSSSANFSLTTRSSSPLFSYRSPKSPPSPPSPTSSLRFSVDKGNRSITVTKKHHRNNNNNNASVTSSSSSSSQKRSCMCSPTTHPGSFRCAYHKRIMEQQQNQTASLRHSSNGTSSRLNLRRSALKNSLMKIGGVEGEILRRPLTTLISSSSHQLRRRETFQPRLTRLSVMSKAQHS